MDRIQVFQCFFSKFVIKPHNFTTAFGATPAFGNASPMGGAASMNKVFGESGGSNTFEALAAQPTGMSFGSLSQKSPEQPKPPAFTG